MCGCMLSSKYACVLLLPVISFEVSHFYFLRHFKSFVLVFRIVLMSAYLVAALSCIQCITDALGWGKRCLMTPSDLDAL